MTKEHMSEAAMTLERCKQQNSELQKQCQDLQAEKDTSHLKSTCTYYTSGA